MDANEVARLTNIINSLIEYQTLTGVDRSEDIAEYTAELARWS